MKAVFVILICATSVAGALYYIFSRQVGTIPRYLYKVVAPETLQASQGKENLQLPAFDDEFIHLATKEQVPNIIKKFFANQPNIKVLTLDVRQLPGKLTLEVNPGGTTKYYHLYDGSIPSRSIINVQSN